LRGFDKKIFNNFSFKHKRLFVMMFSISLVFIVSLSGSFDIVVDDGMVKQTFSLNRSYYGLYLPPGLWRHMQNFSTNSLAMVLSSTHYNTGDYIRQYSEFIKLNQSNEE